MLRLTQQLQIPQRKPSYWKQTRFWGKGGRMRGHKYSGEHGKASLAGKFSYYKIPQKAKNIDQELVTEMWLSRPYLSREITHFMETGEYVPEKGFTNEHIKGKLVEDEQGNYIKPPVVKYPKEFEPLYFKDKLKSEYESKKLQYGMNVRPNVRGTDLWKTMEKYKTYTRSEESSEIGTLDFYQKYHEMAIPQKYPLSMPPPEDNWLNWERIDEFKPKNKNSYSEEMNKFDANSRLGSEINDRERNKNSSFEEPKEHQFPAPLTMEKQKSFQFYGPEKKHYQGSNNNSINSLAPRAHLKADETPSVHPFNSPVARKVRGFEQRAELTQAPEGEEKK